MVLPGVPDPESKRGVERFGARAIDFFGIDLNIMPAADWITSIRDSKADRFRAFLKTGINGCRIPFQSDSGSKQS